jgi:phosphatidylserine/phosphatidylglycerophosphate/cardiolipin synthase-like enzyme
VEDYTNEFEKMFLGHRFGPGKKSDTPFPTLDIGNISLDIRFSPEDRAATRILDLIDGAQESIHFMAFSFTSNDIGDAIRNRALEGVSVKGVMDDTQVKSNQGSEYDMFKQENLDVHLDGNVDGLMHHKVIIIDRQIVITGSYNFTNSAETRNDENMIVLFDPAIASKYLDEFQKIYDRAQP